MYCRAKKHELQTQQMGALPEERLNFGSRPFQFIYLDLLGPTLVKSMVNKRTSMKVWPLLFVCQSTGAVHCEVMHSYGTQAFLLQWERFTARLRSRSNFRPGSTPAPAPAVFQNPAPLWLRLQASREFHTYSLWGIKQKVTKRRIHFLYLYTTLHYFTLH